MFSILNYSSLQNPKADTPETAACCFLLWFYGCESFSWSDLKLVSDGDGTAPSDLTQIITGDVLDSGLSLTDYWLPTTDCDPKSGLSVWLRAALISPVAAFLPPNSSQICSHQTGTISPPWLGSASKLSDDPPLRSEIFWSLCDSDLHHHHNRLPPKIFQEIIYLSD